jgi:alpha-tubulin suppressor-like RCC1 family protein
VSFAPDHACALLVDEHVDCWGAGELGDGTFEPSETPVEVAGIEDAVEISGSNEDTCARLATGHVKCWGGGFYGQLGNSSGIGTDLPVEVLGLSGVEKITTGLYEQGRVCALTEGGQVKCWGYKELELRNPGESEYGSETPTLVEGIEGAVDISSGLDDACAVMGDATVKCWGNNDSGQLGDGSTTSSATPVSVTGIEGATSVTVGDDFACALLMGGVVECWGYNVDGRLGSGLEPAISSSVPVRVSGLG